MTKPPVLQALELLDQWHNYSCLTEHIADAQYPDIRERSEKVAKDLRAWLDGVPKLTDYVTYNEPTVAEIMPMWVVDDGQHILDAGKHLLKGIKDD